MIAVFLLLFFLSVVDAFGQTDSITVLYAPSFPGNTLAGAWGLEDTTSPSTDSSGNANNAVWFNGATTTAQGKYRQGMTFNGTTQYLQVSNTNSLMFTQSFSFSAWVKPAAAYNEWRTVISKQGTGGLYASTAGCGAGGAGVPAMWMYVNGSQAQDFYACGLKPLPIGQWTHLEGTYEILKPGTDDATSQLKLYVDGVLQGTATAANGYMAPDAAAPLRIGASWFGEYFHGDLDEVRAYNWAIPQSIAPNTAWAAACGYTSQADRTDMKIVSVYGDGNCPVVVTTPPVVVKFPANATGLKFGASATGFKVGVQP